MIDIAESYSVDAYLRAVGVDEFSKAFDDASRSVDDVDKNTKKANTSIKNIVKTIAGVAAAVGVFNTLRKAVDGAISRYDTLNNFPKVMEQMGFSATQSERAIERLSDGIQGLPTTLDDVAGTAQRIATMTKDIDGAVETTLALNNAFISSGSDAANASRGLDQYVQMLSKGEIDLQSWRTLQETMGVALNDVAEAFGYAGASAQNDLYDALKDGTHTFDEFNAKLIELSNETGGFADRALTASGGIRTAFANMNTSVVRGVTNIITEIDRALSKTRLESIQNIIETIGRSSFTTLDTISKLVGPVIDSIVFLFNVIKPLTPVIVGLTAALGTFMALSWVSTAVGAMTLAGSLTVLKGAMETVAIASLFVWDALKANPIIAIISLVVGLAAMIVYLWKTNEGFRNVVISSWEAIKNATSAVGDALKVAGSALVEFLEPMNSVLIDGFNASVEYLSDLGRKIGGYFVIAGEHIGGFLSVLGSRTVDVFNKSMEWLADTSDKVIGYFSDLRENMDLGDVLNKVIGPLVTVATLFLGLASPIGWFIKGLAVMATQTSVFTDALAVLSGDMSIGQFVNNLAEGIAQVITYMAESTAEMITKGAELVTGFVEGIAEKLPDIITAGTVIITNFIEGITETIDEIIPIAVGVVSTFIENIATTIPEVANAGIAILTTLIDAIASNLPIVLGVGILIITTLIETIATLIPSLVETGVGIITTLIETIVTMLPLIIDVAVQLIMTIIETVVMMLPILIETYITLITTLIETIVSLLPLVIDTALTLIMTIISVLIENLPLIIDAGIQILMALIEGIITILPILIESIIMIITSLLTVIIENLPLIIDAGIQILMALIAGIVSILPVLLTAAVDLLLALVQTIISLLPKLIDAGIQILLALISGIVSVIPQLLVAAVQLIIQLLGAILKMIPQLLIAGKDLIFALIKGILSLVGSLLSAGVEIIGSLLKGVGEMFGSLVSIGKDVSAKVLDGIKGAAKGFLQAGANIVTSIADGIRGAVGKVTNAIGNVTSKIRDFLPFSPAKEGALKDIMDIQLAESIAKAIDKGRSVAVNAMAGLSSAIAGEMPTVDIAGQVANSSAKINTSIDHDVNRNDSNLENILRQALNRDQVIVMDTGALVGQTADRYNQTFGNNAQNSERWGEG